MSAQAVLVPRIRRMLEAAVAEEVEATASLVRS